MSGLYEVYVSGWFWWIVVWGGCAGFIGGYLLGRWDTRRRIRKGGIEAS